MSKKGPMENKMMAIKPYKAPRAFEILNPGLLVPGTFKAMSGRDHFSHVHSSLAFFCTVISSQIHIDQDYRAYVRFQFKRQSYSRYIKYYICKVVHYLLLMISPPKNKLVRLRNKAYLFSHTHCLLSNPAFQ